MIPGPLNSRLRALSTDVTDLNLGLIPVVLMAFEYGKQWRICVGAPELGCTGRIVWGSGAM